MTRTGTRPIPGPRNPLGIRTTIDFVKQPLDFVMKGALEYGEIFKFRMGLDMWYVFNSAELIHHATVVQANKFHKPKIARRLWKLFLGDGILTAETTEWKRQHNLMKPAFHKKRVNAYGTTMTRQAERMVERWTDGETRNIVDDMSAITLGIAAKTLFDTDMDSDASSTIGEAMHTLNQTMVEHINMPLPVPRWWPSKTNHRKLKAISAVEDIVKSIIKTRRAEGIDRGDLLSMLVFGRDENGEGMSDRELRDQSMTLIFAGHETTALALVWMCYLLSQHPKTVAALREELDAAVGERSLTIDDLSELPYLEMVVKESMRIRPSVWCFMKETVEDVLVDGYRIPKGSTVFISPYVTGHNPLYFPEPDVFRPERFSKENEKKIPKGAYVPFSAGSRVCLGKIFALLEARLILGTLVKEVDFVLPPNHSVELLPQLSLQPKGGLPMQIVKRRRNTKTPKPTPPVTANCG